VRTSSILSAALCLCLGSVQAKVDELFIPSLIRADEEFTAQFTFLTSQPRTAAIVWGVGPASAKVGEMGGYGTVGVTKLDGSG
jgi:hypothetical protein